MNIYGPEYIVCIFFFYELRENLDLRNPRLIFWLVIELVVAIILYVLVETIIPHFNRVLILEKAAIHHRVHDCYISKIRFH